MPNGKLFGMTGGGGNRAVDFCGECHLQVVERDHLFELPEEFVQRYILRSQSDDSKAPSGRKIRETPARPRISRILETTK